MEVASLSSERPDGDPSGAFSPPSLLPLSTEFPALKDYILDRSELIQIRLQGRFPMDLELEVDGEGLRLGDAEPLRIRARTARKIGLEVATFWGPEICDTAVVTPHIASNTYFLAGAVNEPGRYPLKNGTTFLGALNDAGGITEFATGRACVCRQEKMMSIDRRSIRYDPAKDFELIPGDWILITTTANRDMCRP